MGADGGVQQESGIVRWKATLGQKFFDRILEQAEAADLTSDEHFSVDGTLIEAVGELVKASRRIEAAQPPPDDPGNPSDQLSR